jgi:hypothetical protein
MENKYGMSMSAATATASFFMSGVENGAWLEEEEAKRVRHFSDRRTDGGRPFCLS